MCIVVVKPTACSVRKAVTYTPSGGGVWEPPGSENGACTHRGNSGTWEVHFSPWGMNRRRGFGLEKSPLPGEVEWLFDLAGMRKQGHLKVSASEGQPKVVERGKWKS
jgi:hypothetical protein